MPLVDWFSLIIILFFSANGFTKGFVKEFFSTVTLILSLIITWKFGPLLFPFVDSFLKNEQMKLLASFLSLFLVTFLVLKLFSFSFSQVVNFLGLSFVNKTLGAFFGLVKSLAILVSLYLLSFNLLEENRWWLDSYSKECTLIAEKKMRPLFREWKAFIDTQ